jgi:hypothetical protein
MAVNPEIIVTGTVEGAQGAAPNSVTSVRAAEVQTSRPRLTSNLISRAPGVVASGTRRIGQGP